MEPRFECSSLSNPLTNIFLPANRDESVVKIIVSNK